ncbi:MAG: prolyl oligopeptidase family serine peptidase [Phenylobacterium sp.]|uniref:prolyl oligopeptidase family serine peptidase n=1 Tax=Phenylobacterium sp. TaxID=1871053 RepID=UPI002737068C|nr:prolyl oligopeptidase family serine peptidase [Phenylobacterium sp.]MDP3747617.1 prolyl oligopeptidase family serine peptidase [Phenylobacterium sp.]
MRTRSRRRLPQIAALCLALSCGPAAARPLSLDDLLKLEDLGQAAIAPGGRWLVAETLAAHDTAPSFDFDGYRQPALGRLQIVDLDHPDLAQPLIIPEAGAGYVAGPFSPRGRSMVVYRFRDRAWDTGVVDLVTRQVRWLGLPTEQALYGRTVQWRSETELVLIALPTGTVPLHLRTGWQATARLPDLWRQAAEGRVAAVTLAGSGRFLDHRRPAAPRRLLKVDLRSGAVRTLAEGGFFDLELSSTGRYVAAVAEAEPLQPKADEAVRVGTPAHRRALTIVDLATGAIRTPCETCDVLTHLLAWSPAGDALLVFARDRGQAWSAGRLLTIEAATSRISSVGRGVVQPDIAYTAEGIAIVRADWLGAQPVVYGRRSGSKGRADWFRLGGASATNLTERLPEAPPTLSAIDTNALLLVADGAAWQVNPTGGARRLTNGRGRRAQTFGALGLGERFVVNAPPRRGWLLTSAPDAVERVAADTTPASFRIADGAAAVALGDDRLVVRTRDGHGVQQLVLMRSGSPLPVLTVNAALAEVDGAEIRELDHIGPNGQALKSWLYLPPNRPPGSRPPLVVLPYPGSIHLRPPLRYAAGVPSFTPNAQLLAAHGYAVLVPSLPRDRAAGEPAADLADQILKIVDVATDRGLVDRDRLALWGHSFGGYAALVTATQTTRFRAIIAQAAKADLISGWGSVPPFYRMASEEGYPTTLHMGWAESGQASLGSPPWRDPDRYVRNSPVLAADRIRTPVFLIYGDQDFVTLAQGEEMFAALYRQDKDAVLMTLWGEGHIPSSPANIRALYAEVFDWLDRTLNAPAAGQ